MNIPTSNPFLISLPQLLYSLYITGTTRLPINKRQEVYDNGTLILREIQKVTDDGIYTCTTSLPSSSSSKSVSKNSASFRVIILGQFTIHSFPFLSISSFLTYILLSLFDPFVLPSPSLSPFRIQF